MRTIITFQVLSFDQADTTPGNSDSHSRQFEFKGTLDEAKNFLDDVMKKRIEVQENEAQMKLKF